MLVKNYFINRKAALGTKHNKELVIAPILKKALGLNVVIPNNFDSDKFGTFTADVDRNFSQRETAKLKALEAMNLLKFDIGIGSEGSFTPHPSFPSLILNTEIIALIDNKYSFEIYGISSEIVDYAQAREVNNIDEVIEFAKKINFPKHAVVLRKSEKDYSAMKKGIQDIANLKKKAKKMLYESNSIWIETDLRAHVNESRMAHIKKATENLIEIINRACPGCEKPGFKSISSKAGLPCEICNKPTNLILYEIFQCNSCGFKNTIKYPSGEKTAYSGYCDYCNP